MTPGFWVRHFGKRWPLVLAGAAACGMLIGLALSVGTAERQNPYPARDGALEWTWGQPDDPGARQLLALGVDGHAGPWNARKQAWALRCAGLDVEMTALIGAVSLSSQPDGWLSQRDLPTPRQIQSAQTWLAVMAREVSFGNSTSCQEDISWHDSKWQARARSLLEETPQDPGRWQAARQALLGEGNTQQLAQLVLGAGLHDIQGMTKAKDTLAAAGQRLGRATGQPWGLGLDGRIALTLMAETSGDPVAGITRTRPDTQHSPMVEMLAEAKVEVLLHEWFHGLDLVVAPLQTKRAIAGLGWSNQRWWPWQSKSSRVIADGWERSIAVMEEQNDWLWARRKLALKQQSLYWLGDSEAQAYAFQQWARQDLDTAACGQPQNTEEREGGRPTLTEAACLAHAWASEWTHLHQALAAP